MRVRALSLLALVAGAGVLAYAVWTGQAEVGVAVVVPFVVGSGPLPLLGVALLFLGCVGLFYGMAAPQPRSSPGAPPEPDDEADGERDVHAGGVVMIGPIPIVLGTDRISALLAAVAALLVLAGLALALLWT